MQSRESLSEYDRRMHRVLAHIDSHLDQALDLATLAEVANFSAFHFHRLFAAWMGETLGDYLRRRRVEIAAARLLSQPRLSVFCVALSVGFGSGEAFSRAFKAHFGASPTEWKTGRRRQRALHSNPDQRLGNSDQADFHPLSQHAVSTHTYAEHPMQVSLVERHPIRVAYLRNAGPYGEPIARFWQERVYPWMVANNLLGQARYGISLDDPALTNADLCRYDACVEIPAGSNFSPSILTQTLPGGRYAVQRFRGTAKEVATAWDRMLRDWLPASGLQLDARPCFEHYPLDAGYDPATGAFDCEICIPVAPL